MSVVFSEKRMASADGKHELYLCQWKDDTHPLRGVVQISHGMCEYVKRYDELARFFASEGLVVVGNDHLGHGESVSGEDELGYIAEKNGYLLLVKDLRKVTDMIHETYPDVPVILYGHSMGSFVARLYASTYSDGIDGYIFSGTSGPNPLAGVGKILISLISLFKGEKHRSPLVTSMSFGSYCDRIPDAVTGKEWVTGDFEKLREYVNDPHCMFDFTLSAYRDLMDVLGSVSSDKWAQGLRKDIPYLMVSGREDPVGSYGKGVKQVSDMMGKAGVERLSVHLYDGIRHEPHNDVKREEFFDDVLAWIEDNGLVVEVDR